MCHLVLAGSHLLHHKQGKADKAETVSEIFKDDAATNNPAAFRLQIGKQCIHHKRKVKDATQREQRILQSTPGDIVSSQQ